MYHEGPMAGRHGGMGEGCGCGCQGGMHGPGMGMGMGFHRRFVTAEERKARLEEYLQALKAETQAVEEELKKL